MQVEGEACPCPALASLVPAWPLPAVGPAYTAGLAATPGLRSPPLPAQENKEAVPNCLSLSLDCQTGCTTALRLLRAAAAGSR